MIAAVFHRPPMPEPEDEPLPDEHAPPEDEEPVPHPDPVIFESIGRPS